MDVRCCVMTCKCDNMCDISRGTSADLCMTCACTPSVCEVRTYMCMSCRVMCHVSCHVMRYVCMYVCMLCTCMSCICTWHGISRGTSADLCMTCACTPSVCEVRAKCARIHVAYILCMCPSSLLRKDTYIGLRGTKTRNICMYILPLYGPTSCTLDVMHLASESHFCMSCWDHFHT